MDNCAFIKGKEGQKDFVKFVSRLATDMAVV
jgi:hypothetical protein